MLPHKRCGSDPCGGPERSWIGARAGMALRARHRLGAGAARTICLRGGPVADQRGSCGRTAAANEGARAHRLSGEPVRRGCKTQLARCKGSYMKPEDVIADRTRPYTGAEYMQSLRDGREVYIDGERVADVTTHSALRNSVRSIARLYDALHDPKRHELLTCPTDTGSGGYTHRFFRVPRSREDLCGAQQAI